MTLISLTDDDDDDFDDNYDDSKYDLYDFDCRLIEISLDRPVSHHPIPAASTVAPTVLKRSSSAAAAYP